MPGALSQSYLQKENYLSAATRIARGVTSNSFDGAIEYDVDGNMIAGFDVQVYAADLRNPFDVRSKSREFLWRLPKSAYSHCRIFLLFVARSSFQWKAIRN